MKILYILDGSNEDSIFFAQTLLPHLRKIHKVSLVVTGSHKVPPGLGPIVEVIEDLWLPETLDKRPGILKRLWKTSWKVLIKSWFKLFALAGHPEYSKILIDGGLPGFVVGLLLNEKVEVVGNSSELWKFLSAFEDKVHGTSLGLGEAIVIPEKEIKTSAVSTLKYRHSYFCYLPLWSKTAALRSLSKFFQDNPGTYYISCQHSSPDLEQRGHSKIFWVGRTPADTRLPLSVSASVITVPAPHFVAWCLESGKHVLLLNPLSLAQKRAFKGMYSLVKTDSQYLYTQRDKKEFFAHKAKFTLPFQTKTINEYLTQLQDA
jgi:hypothetical protein